MTLTEALIVVVILATLATLVLPRFFGQEERGVAAEAIANLSVVRQAEAAYHLEHSAYTGNMTLLDIDDPSIVAGRKFNYTVDAATGAVTATRVGGGADFNGKQIILHMNGTWGGDHSFKPK